MLSRGRRSSLLTGRPAEQTRRRNRRTWVLPAVCLMLTGCPTPTQYGGPIPINTAGMDQRMAWVCGMGQSNPDVSAFCVTDGAEPAAALPAPAASAVVVVPGFDPTTSADTLLGQARTPFSPGPRIESRP